MKNKIILCILCLACGFSAVAQPNITFTAKSATNTAINPQIDISSENGRPFIYGSNLIFASFSIQLTNGFYEIFGLAPGNYVLDIAAWGQRFTMKVPNTTNTYNWLQLINGIYSCSNNSFFITQSEPLPVTLTNPANIFAGAEFTGAFQGDGSGLTNMPYVPLSNFLTVITAGQLIIQDLNGIHLVSLQGSNAGGTHVFSYGDGIGGGAIYITPRQGVTIDAPQGAGFIQLTPTVFTIGQNISGTGATNELPNQTLQDTNSILTPQLAAQIPVGTNQLPGTLPAWSLLPTNSFQKTNNAITNIVAGAGLIGSTNPVTGAVILTTNGAAGGGGGGATNFAAMSATTGTFSNTATINAATANSVTVSNTLKVNAATFETVISSNGFTGPATGLTAIPSANLTGTIPFGLGVPPIVGSFEGSSVGDLSPFVLYTAPSQGMYVVAVYLQIISTDISGQTIDVPVTYTSLNGAQTFDPIGSQGFTGTGDFQALGLIYLASGQSVSCQRVLSAPLAVGDFTATITVFRLR